MGTSVTVNNALLERDFSNTMPQHTIAESDNINCATKILKILINFLPFIYFSRNKLIKYFEIVKCIIRELILVFRISVKSINPLEIKVNRATKPKRIIKNKPTQNLNLQRRFEMSGSCIALIAKF